MATEDRANSGNPFYMIAADLEHALYIGSTPPLLSGKEPSEIYLRALTKALRDYCVRIGGPMLDQKQGA